MDDPFKMCELTRLDDVDRLSEVGSVLEARGIETDIWPEKRKGPWLLPWSSRTSCLMVRCRDVVYARWVASEAGLDTWPDDPGSDVA